MASRPALTFKILQGADDDARALDRATQALWATAVERLKSDPTETFSMDDPEVTSGPPIRFYIGLSSERAIFVGYKYIPESNALTIISVESYPVHDEKPVPYQRRSDYASA